MSMFVSKKLLHPPTCCFWLLNSHKTQTYIVRFLKNPSLFTPKVQYNQNIALSYQQLILITNNFSWSDFDWRCNIHKKNIFAQWKAHTTRILVSKGNRRLSMQHWIKQVERCTMLRANVECCAAHVDNFQSLFRAELERDCFPAYISRRS